jgi:hypothetical protein
VTAARVYVLSDYRPTEPVPMTPRAALGKRRRPGLFHRVMHSPFARDVRANPIAVGLLLSVVLVLIWAVTQ